MRLRHVINTVGRSARPSLLAEQDRTLATIELATKIAPDHVDVGVVGVRYPDERQAAAWLDDRWHLTRSALDIGEFERPRCLPLLHDVLAPFRDGDYDVGIYTNVDIAVQPRFYELVAELVGAGYDSFVINRRTVDAYDPAHDRSALMSLQVGRPHPGHDCFVFRREVLDGLDVDQSVLGVAYVMRPMLLHLMLNARRFREFIDLHATYHIGDDRAWADPALADYVRHNQACLYRVIDSLMERFGRSEVLALPTVRRTLAVRRGDAPNRMWTRRGRRLTTARSFDRRRLVFAASPGRSGSQFLARVIDTSANARAQHEPDPRMNAEHLRAVAYRPPAESYEQRRSKADALAVQLDLLRQGEVYAETSHMFIKTYADVVFDAFNHDLISVVCLRRPLVETAKSMAELGWFSPFNREWDRWLIPPTAPFAKFRIDLGAVESRFDMILGYLLDTETRIRDFRLAVPDVSWIDVSPADLSDREALGALWKRLGLQATDATWAAAKSRVNRRRDTKLKRGLFVDDREVLDAAMSFRDRFAYEILRTDVGDRFDELDQWSSDS